ncbi:hypothetical protein CONLIGDRAFT_53859 [Coniochaeta ligniaria NRRL 30616]|uniref:Uncharacterized protein n=1 Tax=Coniochaeta ligniaria NRRL 30616 TaxID=1408157 RepID=A0A1J7J7A3_9PEZI|nr:hypothetical protein CONLIGDRAFT_53859 [Coniochaeta ligniaria NRRL 30616]
MCFRNTQKSKICGHLVLGDLIPCDLAPRRSPKAWYKKFGGSSEPEHCGSVRAIDLPDQDPNLCPRCIDERLGSPRNINKTNSPAPKDETRLIRPGPAQRRLTETCGMRPWDSNIDIDSIEKAEEALQKRLDAIEASSHLRSSSRRKSGLTVDTQTGSKYDEGKKPLPKPGLNRRGTDFRQGATSHHGHHEEGKRQKVENSGGYMPPFAPKLPVSETGMNREGVDWEVIDDYERYKRKTSRTYTPPRLQRATTGAPLETKDKIFDNLVAQVERQDLGRHPTAKQHHPRPATRAEHADTLYRGEHPNVAYARHLANDDYRRRKGHEPGLVDPSTVPVDTSWQARTYSGPVVGEAWLKLAKELYPDGDPLAQWRDQEVSLPNTSAVPNPLALQNSLLAKHGVQEPYIGGRSQTRAPARPPSPHKGQMLEYYSYLWDEDEDDSSPGPPTTRHKGKGKEPQAHLAAPPRPRRSASYVPYKEDKYDNFVAPCSVPTPAKPSRERKTVSMGTAPPTQRDRSYFAVPAEADPRYLQPPEDDNRRCEVGGSESGSEKAEKPVKSRPKRLSLQKRLSNGKGPDSSVSWKSASSTASSSSVKSWFKSKLGLSDKSDTASFKCKDAAQIEGQRR